MEIIGTILNSRYLISEKIGESEISISYVGQDLNNESKDVVVKVLKQELLSSNITDIIRFKNEVEILSKLDNPNILKIIDTDKYNDYYYMVTEFATGKKLFHLLKNNLPLSVDFSVELIFKIAAVLGTLHKISIIHRDLNPANIYIDEKLNSIKITGFALSYIKECVNINASDEIFSMFGYISPEQYGAIAREVDERSDIYSLGIIFYRMITAKMPYEGENIRTLIHQHLAHIPNAPSFYNPEVPTIIDSIVMKMIAKDPDDRYQSVGGLKKDIEKYKSGYRKIAVGLDDEIDFLKVQVKPIGLEEIIHTVIENINKAACGMKGAVIVSGEYGSGKTRFVNELKSYSIIHNGVFIYSKCFKSENKIPYGPFKDIINNYLQKFDNYSEQKKSRIISKIENELGDLRELLLKFSITLQKIIGNINPLITDLSLSLNDDEIKRFLSTLTHFFEIISEEENFLIIAVEDIQWADEGTIKLITAMLSERLNSKLLLLTTFRNNEITNNEFFTAINSRRSGLAPITRIDIAPFDDVKMTEFVSKLLQMNNEDVPEISAMLLEKSKGNPQFALELLYQSIREKAIEKINGKWLINKKKIANIDSTFSVIDIIQKRMESLNSEEKTVLMCAAVIGRKFNIEILFESIDMPKENVIFIIDKSIRLYILEEISGEKNYFIFTNDKVYDSLYNSIEPTDRKNKHNRIALLLENQNIENLDKLIFQILHHFFEADNLEKVYEYSYPAALIAKENYAYDDALRYFMITKELMEVNNSFDSDKWFQCNVNIGEINITLGTCHNAITLFRNIMDSVKDNDRKSYLYYLISRAYYKIGDFSNSEIYAKSGLKILGEDLPVKSNHLFISFIFEFLIHFVRKIIPDKIFFKYTRKNRRYYRQVILFYETLIWIYNFTDTKKSIRSIIRLLNLCEFGVGRSRELSTAYRFFASLFSAKGNFVFSLKYFQKAIKLEKELNNKRGYAHTLQMTGYFYQWQSDYLESKRLFNDSIEHFNVIGDVYEIGKSRLGNYFNNYFLSEYEQAEKDLQEYIKYSEKTKDNFGIYSSKIYLVRLLIEKGDYELAERMADDIMIEVVKLKYNILEFLCAVELGKLYIVDRRYKNAVEILDKAIALYNKEHFLEPLTVFVYPYLAEAHLKFFREESMLKGISLEEIKRKMADLKKLCRLALRKTKKWSNHYANALRVYALYFSYYKNFSKASYYFDKAVEFSTKIDRKYQLARVYYDYGLMLLRTSSLEEGRDCIEKAFYIFTKINSRVYRKRAYSLLESKNEISPMQRLMDREKLDSIVKVSQSISSILNQSKLVDMIMKNAVEVSGAQRGFLFLLNDETGQLELRASRTTGDHLQTAYPASIIDIVFKTGKIFIAANAQKDPELSNDEFIKKLMLKSILCTPIQTHEKVIGVCYLDNPLATNVFNQDDADLLNVFITQGAIALENAALYNNLEKKVDERTGELNHAYGELQDAYNKLQIKDRIISEDLNLAKKVQNSLLSSDVDKIDDLTFSVLYHPMSEVGGDFYDILLLRKHFVRIFIADATGHGVQAALLTMIIKSEYDKIRTLTTPGALLEKLNNILVKNYSSLNLFLTSFVIDIDTSSNIIKYASAGHPASIMLQGESTLMLNAAGKMLGVIDDIQYETKVSPFGKNDKLFLFTDGAFEQFNTTNEEFGIDRLTDIMLSNSKKPVATITENIISALQLFTGDTAMNANDDLTIIAVERK